MAYKNIVPQAGEIYHVYNRGVDKRDIFVDRVDYIRFLHDLYEFNDANPAPAFERRYKSQNNTKFQNSFSKQRLHEPMVDILAFCLMKNHYHLLIRPIFSDSMSLFMKKLNTGYAYAFNVKHDRSGHLFQGRYKIKHVDDDKYLKHLVCYIHLNPLKFLEKLDRNKHIDIHRTWKALNSYRWSSHLDYLDQDNFNSIINKRFINDIFGTAREYKDFAKDWIKSYNKNMIIIDSVALDFDSIL